MEIDPFVTIDHDLEKKKLNVGVENRAERHQREMWGWFHPFSAQLTVPRYNKSISSKPYLRRV
jgi:hypothetical protein